jgi:hypothetical protein
LGYLFSLDSRDEIVAGIKALEKALKQPGSVISYPSGGGMTTRLRTEILADVRALYVRLDEIDGTNKVAEHEAIAFTRVIVTTGL